jgi:hypothetical protein
MTNPTPEELSQWLADLAKDEPDVAEMMSHGGRTAFLEGGWYSESDVDVLLTLAATEHHKVTEQSEGMARLQENKDQLLQALAAYEEQVTEQAKLLEEAREVIQRLDSRVWLDHDFGREGPCPIVECETCEERRHAQSMLAKLETPR